MRKRTTTILMGLMAAQMAGAVWAAPAPSAPKPIASAVAPNGNVVEFYEGEDGVLVSETGVAGSNPVFDPLGKRPDRLLEAWRSVAPKDPFPQALAQLEKRMKAIHKLAIERSKSSAHKDPLPPPPVLFKSGPESKPASKPAGGLLMPGSSMPKSGMTTMGMLEGCDNGCCDREWLATFDQCSGSSADFNWFLFNYGYTWANSEDIWIYKGLVCSANGTSWWNLKIGDTRWTWDVAHGYYRTWWWKSGWSIWCGGNCGKDMTSTVNSPTAQQLHTYCGWTFHD